MKISPKIVRVQIGPAEDRAFIHTFPNSAISTVARFHSTITIQTDNVSTGPNRKLTVWTFLLIYDSEESACVSNRQIFKSNDPVILRHSPSITAILALNHEAVQSFGFDDAAVSALAKRLNRSLTKVTAPGRSPTLHLLHAPSTY